MCCELHQFGLVMKPLHMMELSRLAGLMPREENHDSMQGTQESVPQSSIMDDTEI